MASATWTPATNGSTATWSKNQELSDLQALAPLYNDPTISYNDPLVYYNGYDPNVTPAEGVPAATWTPSTAASPSTWAKVAE